MKCFNLCGLNSMKPVFIIYFVSLLPVFSCNEKAPRSIEPEKKTVDETNIIDSLASDTISNNMVSIKGGSFLMGSNDPDFPDAIPVHEVFISDFMMDEHEVSNHEFARFVKETGYITIAERPLDPEDFPGVDPSKLVPGSAVFSPPKEKVGLDDPLAWWKYVPGASWHHPFGPSGPPAKANEPVVHICYDDAVAYATWAGKRLPTEAEWEYAARAGKLQQTYYWGSELKPGGKWVANIFQGTFPNENTSEDGYLMLSPVKSFSSNTFGLYDMEGNVWEWCNDFYRPDYYANSPKHNPKGPSSSFDPDEPGMAKRVQRGGSFLCSDQYCIRYKAGSRGKGEEKSGANNLGFRCVK